MFLRLVSRRAKVVSVAALIPNLLTTVALCAGLASLHFSLQGHWEKALAAILVSAVFDALDGRAARLLHVTSNFGAVLDSLSDFLAFGVAPAVILHQWLLAPQEGAPFDMFSLAAVVTYPLCAGLRLARFTSAPPISKVSASAANYFVGMPTPAAAGAVMVAPMLAVSDTVAWRAPREAIILYTFVVALLMISRVPMFSLKKLRINRRLVAPLLVLVGLAVVMMVKDAWLTLSAISGAYLLTLPASVVMRRRARQAELVGAGPRDASGSGGPAQGRA